MLRLMGAALLVCGGAAAGAGQAMVLFRRAETLRALAEAVGRMGAEIGQEKTPMPELLRRMEETAAEPVRPFFARVRRGMEQPDRQRFSALWCRCAEEALGGVLKGEALSAAAEAGLWLGRYEARRQAEALERICRRLEGLAAEAGARAGREGRVRGILGLAAGACCAILLF